MFDLAAALALGYFIGSFPSAALVARMMGRNIFEVGSGNMGAMNTARHLGWLPGVAVLALDIGKGALAVSLTAVLAQVAVGTADTVAPTGDPTVAVGSAAVLAAMPLAAGVGAVSGHAWSVFTGFRGGKALATALGVALPVYPLGGLYAVLLMIALMLLTRRTTLSALITMTAYPAVVGAALHRAGVDTEQIFAVVTSVVLISAIVIYKHLRTETLRRTEQG